MLLKHICMLYVFTLFESAPRHAIRKHETMCAICVYSIPIGTQTRNNKARDNVCYMCLLYSNQHPDTQ